MIEGRAQRANESCSMYMGVPTSLGAWMSIGISSNAMLGNWRLESLHGECTADDRLSIRY